jgi:hypothetical protein
MLTLTVLLYACNEDSEPIIDPSNLLIGAWGNPSYVENNITFTRVAELSESGYGISFNVNSSILEHKNAGFCGTPPISYDNFEGNWSQDNDIVSISSTYWGGVYNYKWKIISVNKNELLVKNISDD